MASDYRILCRSNLVLGVKNSSDVCKELSDFLFQEKELFEGLNNLMNICLNVYRNLEKLISFIITSTLTLTIYSIIGIVCTGEVPLSSVQMLWVSFVHYLCIFILISSRDEFINRQKKTKYIVSKVISQI